MDLDLIVGKHDYYKEFYTISNCHRYWGIYDITDKLLIDKEDVCQQLKLYDYTLVEEVDVLLFKNKEDTEKFLEWLTPFIIAAKLIY